jgi:hypothetical protein
MMQASSRINSRAALRENLLDLSQPKTRKQQFSKILLAKLDYETISSLPLSLDAFTLAYFNSAVGIGMNN